MATNLEHSNGTLSVYADSDETPLCTIDLKEEYQSRYGETGETTWKQIDTNKEFYKVLPAGEHTFRFVFEQKQGYNFTSDFSNFALYNTSNQ